MGSSSSRSANFGHSHGSRRSHDSSTSPYDSIEDERTLYFAVDRPPRWRRKHFLSANKSLAGRIAKHRKAVGAAAGAKSPAAPAPASSCRRRRKSSKKRKASDSGRGSDECDCASSSGGDGGDRASSDEGGESLVSCRYCDEEEEEELRTLEGGGEIKFVPEWPL